MTSYRTFWVVCSLYFVTLAFTTASGMEVLKWFASLIEGFGQKFNINRIPLYHFPDVWQNLVWISGLFKIVLSIMVVISITNEYQYRTIHEPMGVFVFENSYQCAAKFDERDDDLFDRVGNWYDLLS